jgi:hypothetical protein
MAVAEKTPKNNSQAHRIGIFRRFFEFELWKKSAPRNRLRTTGANDIGGFLFGMRTWPGQREHTPSQQPEFLDGWLN